MTAPSLHHRDIIAHRTSSNDIPPAGSCRAVVGAARVKIAACGAGTSEQRANAGLLPGHVTPRLFGETGAAEAETGRDIVNIMRVRVHEKTPSVLLLSN